MHSFELKMHVWESGAYYIYIFFKIQFWYLRCCGCPWNRGRQHLATPLKTCHNTEAGFSQGGCSAYPPTQRWRHLRLRRSRTWAVCLLLSPQKGDHPPSHDDNFARTSVCRWLPQKPTASHIFNPYIYSPNHSHLSLTHDYTTSLLHCSIVIISSLPSRLCLIYKQTAYNIDMNVAVRNDINAIGAMA